MSRDVTPIAFERLGDGEPVVLVGGALQGQATYRPLAVEALDKIVLHESRRSGPAARGATSGAAGSRADPGSVGTEPPCRRRHVQLRLDGDADRGARPPWPRSRDAGERTTILYDLYQVMSQHSRGGMTPAEQASRVILPALVLAGGASPEWMIDASRQIADALPNGNSASWNATTTSCRPRPWHRSSPSSSPPDAAVVGTCRRRAGGPLHVCQKAC